MGSVHIHIITYVAMYVDTYECQYICTYVRMIHVYNVTLLSRSFIKTHVSESQVGLRELCGNNLGNFEVT